MPRAGLLLSVIALVVVGAAAGASSAPTNRIVFAANRAPLWYGEIYRVGLDGKRVDLSRSPAADVGASVSTDGRSVAFLSARGGSAAVYVVGMTGRHPMRVSPFLYPASGNRLATASIAWSPDSRRLAVVLYGGRPGLYLTTLGGSWHAVAGTHDLGSAPAWSPDGRLIAFVVPQAGEVRVIDPSGKTRWTAAAQSVAWSARGRLAVQENSYTVGVYDEAGRALASLPAGASAWSPNGDRLATLTPSGKTVEIRAGGTGAPTFRRTVTRVSTSMLGWLGATRLRFYGANGWLALDLTHLRVSQLAGAYAPFGSVPYADGTEAVAELFAKTRSLVVTRLAGGSHTLATAPSCGDENTFSNLQFLPGGRGVVYASSCGSPAGDIYSVAPDGTALRNLTKTAAADDTQPAVSPDGRSIAYVQDAFAGNCHGCPHSLWLMNADGTGAHALPNAPDSAGTPYDDSPSFSPDGTQILFNRSGPSSSGLAVEPAAGGDARALGVPGFANDPAWGPQRIAYSGNRVVTAAPDGTVDRPATRSGRVLHGIPAWSAQGRLAVLDSANGKLTLYIADITMPGARIALPGLTAPFPAGAPAWSPDGTRIAFAAVDREGVGDVYTIGVDGHDLRRVTHDLGAVSGVSWR